MSYAEFSDWVRFYLEHPFDDEHRYHRPAALVARSMAKNDMADMLSWLKDAAVQAPDEGMLTDGRFSEADLRTFAALGMKPRGV